MEAKVNYILKNLGKPLVNEKAFPLLLHYNYHGVIKPRCELLKEKMKTINFEEVLPVSDEEFCRNFNIPMEELERKKAEKPIREEKDTLWSYVPAL